ncbi:MAG: hypothetical protein A2408_03800 [Candidatus Yonathbacteria bacterium RIFOXYC1_FULL_52_10]|uniref:Uncharacterized protein n=1 Tax=Candidatus Yonathbacteria bacterium RIFOXYD1_FULL_52_36 TaxID=1802730 RepID=A0A1G2SLQ3_9BACT|nr:MAG: hypothetical protein A2408_03800 [Candidatus Yonathbacteria bacterium RIFOXYC1_FULL_52_10]OHA85947.1 MAG: hypothetical protein A2591_00050 [Candidatus Yonathbacteria bacterium RIFOXYD1_FULL_52_36]
MLTQELIEYIRQAQNAGMTPEQIRKALAESGWAEADITQALSAMNAAFDSGRADRIAASVTPATATTSNNLSPTTESSPPAVREPIIQNENPIDATPPETRAPHKRTALIVTLLVLGLIILGGAYVAYAIYAQTPGAMLSRAEDNASSTHTYVSDIFMGVSAKETGQYSSAQPMTASFSLNARSEEDLRDTANPKMHATATLTGNFGGVSASGDLEATLLEKTFFIRIKDLPAFVAAIDADFAAYIRGRWFSIDAQKFPDGLRALGASEDDVTETRAWLTETLTFKNRYMSLSQTLTDFLALTKPESPIAGFSLKETGETIIGDESTRSYFVSGTKEAWIALAEEGAKTRPEVERTAIERSIAELRNNTTAKDLALAVTFWVGKESHMLRKYEVVVSGIEQREASNGLRPESTPLSVEFTFRFSEIFSAFNEPVTVIRPDPATPLIEVLEQAQRTVLDQSTGAPR